MPSQRCFKGTTCLRSYIVIRCTLPANLTTNLHHARFVRFGNPALYRWAYPDNTDLYVPSWRSVYPVKANRFLSTHIPDLKPTEVQGRILLENLAMSVLTQEPRGVDSSLKTRHNLRTAPRNLTIVRMIAMAINVWRIQWRYSCNGELESSC